MGFFWTAARLIVGFPGLSLDELELDPEGFAPVRLGGPLLEPLEPPLEGLDMDLVDPILLLLFGVNEKRLIVVVVIKVLELF